jgi:hypothetical protein
VSAKPGPRGASNRCHTCQEFRLAEALANDRHDYSAATDCRVLLRRHRGTADCTERGPA